MRTWLKRSLCVVTVGVIGSVSSVQAGCNGGEESFNEPTPSPSPNRARPSCGAPGTLVELDVYVGGEGGGPKGRCDTPDDIEVQFSGIKVRPSKVDNDVTNVSGTQGPGERVEKGTRCLITVAVPEGAGSGPVYVAVLNPPGNEFSKAIEVPPVFEVPCPADAGVTADSGSDSAAPPDKWAGEVSIVTTESPAPPNTLSTTVGAVVYKAVTADDEAAVAAEAAYVRGSAIPTSTPLGTCVVGDLSPEPPASPPPASLAMDLGASIDVRNKSTNASLLTVNRGGNNKYSGFLSPGIAAGTPLNIVLGGDLTTSVGGAMASRPTVTQPLPDATLSKSGFTVAWTPFVGDSFILSVGFGKSFSCNLDPKAGTFTVPADKLQELPNGSTSLRFRAAQGTVTPVTIGGQPRSITTFTFLSFSIGGTLN